MGFRPSLDPGQYTGISAELLGNAYKTIRAVEAKLGDIDTFLESQEAIENISDHLATILAIGDALDTIAGAGDAATSAAASAATATTQAGLATTAKNTAQTAATAASGSASAAAISQAAAAISAANASSSADTAALHLAAVQALSTILGEGWLGAFAVAPTLDNGGNPLEAGDFYWDTFIGQFGAWSESTEEFIYLTGGEVVTADGVILAPAGGISSNNVQAAIYELDSEKAPKNNPTFTGTVAGVTKGMVGLGSVDDTSDADKPISDATQAAFDSVDTAISGKQDLNSVLTTLSGMTPTAYGLDLLEIANAAALAAHFNAIFQGINSELTAIALLTTTSFGRSLLTLANVAAAQAALDLVVGEDVQAYDVDTAKLDVEDQVISGGARVTSKSLGTVTSGTKTLDPGDRPLQHYTNNGAHVLAPGTNAGSIILDVLNGTTPGAITLTGWTKVVGSFTTVANAKFRCSASIGSNGSLLTIQAM